MRTSKLLNATLIFAGAVLFQPAYASVRALPPPVSDSGNIGTPFLQTYEHSLAKVNKMLSYVNLAYISIDMGKYSRAVSDVRIAQTAANQLEAASPTFVTESKLKYGKLTYDIKGQQVSYYIPDSGGQFIIHDYDGFLGNTVKTSDQIVDRDARMVSASLDVNLGQAKRSLNYAASDLKYERYNSARVELAELHQNALIGETDVEDSVRSVHDNLRLAQALLNVNQYSTAKDALEHAREELDSFKTAATLGNNANIIQQLDNEIISLEMRLRGKSPVHVQRAEQQINQWIHTMDGWKNTTYSKMG